MTTGPCSSEWSKGRGQSCIWGGVKARALKETTEMCNKAQLDGEELPRQRRRAWWEPCRAVRVCILAPAQSSPRVPAVFLVPANRACCFCVYETCMCCPPGWLITATTRKPGKKGNILYCVPDNHSGVGTILSWTTQHEHGVYVQRWPLPPVQAGILPI